METYETRKGKYSKIIKKYIYIYKNEETKSRIRNKKK